MSRRNPIARSTSIRTSVVSVALLLFSCFVTVEKVNAQAVAEKSVILFAEQTSLGRENADVEMTSARRTIQEFCLKLSSDYGVKVRFEDFAESGSREQLLKFAQQLGRSQASFDAACQRMAKKLNPFYQGKLNSHPHAASLEDRVRGTRGR